VWDSSRAQAGRLPRGSSDGFWPSSERNRDHLPLVQGCWTSGALIEVVLIALFVIVGVTSKWAPAGFAPIAIGLTLVFIQLAAIPVSNASVNPARSTATAIFAGGAALTFLWLFWVAPIVGGNIGGYASR